MGGPGGESDYYNYARRFCENKISDQQATKHIRALGVEKLPGEMWTSLFEGLKKNQSPSPSIFFEDEASDRLELNEPTALRDYLLPYEPDPFVLILGMMYMISYRVREADRLLGFDIFHSRTGRRRGFPKMVLQNMVRISSLTESPIHLMLAKGNVSDKSDFGTYSPWYVHAMMKELKEYRDVPSLSFTTGKVLLPGLSRFVGLSLVQLQDFNQLSITLSDETYKLKVKWDKVLIDFAAEYCGLKYPAVYTHASEFLTSTDIFRLSWGGLPRDTSHDKLLVRLYSRILSSRTRQAMFYDAKGKELLKVYHPVYHQDQVVKCVTALPFIK